MLERRVRAYWAIGICVLAFAFAVPADRASAQAVASVKSLKESSLALVPQDVAFFSANMNLREAWKDFLTGSFVTRLRSVPYVQRLEAEGLAQWDNPEGQMKTVRDTLKNPNVQNLLSLLADMNSQEVFFYGASDWNESISGLMWLYQDITARSDEPEALQEFVAELDAEYLDELTIPTTVVGFRLSDDKIARTLLDALQGVLQFGMQQIPELAPLAEQISRKDLKDGQVLSIALSADLIPVDKLEPEVQEMLGGVLEALEGRKLVISLGLRNKVLLMSISEESSPLLTIGEGDKLVEHEKFEILLDNLPKNLRNVSYISKEWRESQWQASYGNYFQNLANQFATAVSSETSDEVDVEEWQEEILADAAEMDEYIADLEVEFDAALSWSFASDIGLEGMAYDWSENQLLENAEPMSIVRHAGTQPLLIFAMKTQAQPAINELLAQAIDRAPAHIERFIALAEQEEEKRDVALKVLEEAWPLVEDVYRIVNEEILPSVDENESLLSISSLWTTTEVSLDLPPAESPLPLPEIGFAIKVRNRDQFLAGCNELFGVFDKVVEVVREFNPDSVPADYSVPRPEREELAGATRFYYSELAQGFPIEGFQPQVIVGNDAIVMGYSARQVTDLVADKPLTTRPAWLEPDMPVAAMSMVDWAGMVNSVTPWMTYGFQIATGDLNTPLGPGEGPIPTGKDVVQIWECLTAFGRMAATSVIDEDGITVSRWVWVGE